MRFVYGKSNWPDRERGQENCYLLTNGLGGFSSGSMINSNTRNDHALLMAALAAPNVRYNMVNRLEEILEFVPKEGVSEIITESVLGAELPESGPAGAYEVPPCRRTYLSSQEYVNASRNENGYLALNSFVVEDYPEWTFQVDGVEVVKRVAMRQGENLTAVEYRIDNRTGREVCLTVTPHLQFVPKGKELEGEPEFEIRNYVEGNRAGSAGDSGNLYEILSGNLNLFFRTSGDTELISQRFCEGMFYAYDACDGRNALGRTCVNHRIRKHVPPHGQDRLEIIYLAGGGASETVESSLMRDAEEVFREASEYRKTLRETALYRSPDLVGDMLRPQTSSPWNETVLQLVMSANQFISERTSTGGRTILAGYPFFEDWGRDTMIALEGCCMTTGQMDTARSILRTFAKYCRRGLMPNLFPEGGREPMYNTVDAALLFINSVYRYYARTEDEEFAREMWPVMAEIVDSYKNGTDYGIHMDEDGLIMAGRGLDQVTWMDVRIGDYLPTPRHGKPVEVNACWYNALRVMEQLEGELTKAEEAESERRPGAEEAEPEQGPGAEEETGSMKTGGFFGFDYGSLAEKVRDSFREKFWMEEKGYLRDVISDEKEKGERAEAKEAERKADEQFRCNQIWAVSMPFTMLDRSQERQIVDRIYEELYTPLGLRTLNQGDAAFHGSYGGTVTERDSAYHQGTVWVFPLGAYYLAYLKTREYSAEACALVRRQLEAVESALREGCIGQLPEIYDGGNPAFSRGCFAQAWSVGEILRVYEELGKQERKNSRMPRYENYVFDLYGTLIDIRTDEEDMQAWKRMALFYRYQGADYKAKELKKAYEKAVRKALKESAAGGSVDTAEICIEDVFRKLYEKKGVEPEKRLVFDTCRIFRIATTRRIRLFPGVKEGLQKLREEGARLYLLSNAQRAFTEKELEMFGLENYFDGMILSSDRGVKKPDRRFFDALIETYHLNPARTLMTGDDWRCDIEGARRAGMDGFFVGQGKRHMSYREKAARS